MNHIETVEDIENLIRNKIQESITLEYKRELGDNTKIAKNVSAFANTLGGTIIYGVKEENGLPTSINWIEGKGIKERIESIILSSIQPRIKDVKINPISKPDDPTKAIFIVHIPESLEAPHMTNHYYYKRHNFKSEPMNDREVKNAMFNRGLREALKFEIYQNLEILDKTLKSIKETDRYRLKERRPLLFIPFYTETWRTIVNSGLFYILKEKSTRLVEAYSLIHEINNIIDYQKYNNAEMIVINPTYDSQGKHMPAIYIPDLIRNKLPKLCNLLEEIKKEFIEH